MRYERPAPPGNADADRTTYRSAAADPSTQKLIAELQGLTTGLLDQALIKLFTGADDVLFDRARKAGNNRDQANYLETMRSVRLGRSWIQQRFLQEVARCFLPPVSQPRKPAAAALDFDTLTMTENTDVEKAIAITNVADRANDLYKQPLWEIGRRFNTLNGLNRTAVSSDAITPATLCEAFRIAVDSHKLEVSAALVLYELFDRFVIPELGTLYATVLKLFDQHSIRPERVTVPVQPSAPAAAPAARKPQQESAPAPQAQPAAHWQQPQSSSASYPTESMMQGGGGLLEESLAEDFPLPPDLQSMAAVAFPKPRPPGEVTLQILEQLGSTFSGLRSAQGYSDHHLAADLAGAALGRMVPGWEPAHAKAYVRRTDAVGQMFNGIIDDPNMPNELKPRFDELRFSVMKTALQDVSFFANPQHPVSGLVNELATLAASARATSMDALQRIEDLVGRIQDQFQVAAESVRHPKVDPLEHIEIERFLGDQIDKNRQRRKAVIDKVKRVVEEELTLRSAGRAVPAPALRLFRSGWAPMMAAHLLRNGMGSEPWREGLVLLEEMLNSLDPAKATPAGGPAALVARVDDKLAGVGMGPTRRKELLDAFLPALLQAETKRASARAPQPQTAVAPKEAMVAAPPAAPEAAAIPNETAPQAGIISRDSLIETIVVPGSWFRVVDPTSNRDRWMRAVTYYPERGNVAFAEFNGRNLMYLKTDQFIEGLFDNRVEPLDLMPMAKDLLDRFLAQAAPRP